jgi:cell fate regulator YaaT (PSP1 superfamily)
MASDPMNPNAAVVCRADDDRPAESGSRKPGPVTLLVRYGAMAWVGEFTARPGTRPGCYTPLVVQTERGIELGQPLRFCSSSCPISIPQDAVRTYVHNSGPEFCRPNAGRVLREATSQDMNEHLRLNAHPKEDLELCAELASQLALDVKIVAAEHLLGGERIVFYFRSEGRIDFRELVKELAHRYHTRIEMRQVGARDEARLVADWEVCGLECCCRTFLKKLRPVNMKMAKLQKSTLDPSKVSGRCGRLRCCLRYEHEGYTELAAKLPRRGTRVRTRLGVGTVVEHQVLTQLVLVRTDELNEYAVPLEEILEFNLPRPRPPAAGPETRDKPTESAAGRPARDLETETKPGRRGMPGKRSAADEPVVEEKPLSAAEVEPPVESDSPHDSDADATASDQLAESPARPRGIRRRRGGRRRNRRRPGADREPAPGDS